MKRTVSAGKSSRSKESSISGARRQKFVVCVRNEKYPVSLEVGKIYRALPDQEAAARGLLRVIDESGEDYLYPAGLFLPIAVSKTIQHALSLAS